MPNILPPQFAADPEEDERDLVYEGQSEIWPHDPTKPMEVHLRTCGDRQEAVDQRLAGLPFTCVCGARKCPAHPEQYEPCPTCSAYIAAGL